MPQGCTLGAPLGDYIQVLTKESHLGHRVFHLSLGNLYAWGFAGMMCMCVNMYTCVSVCVYVYAYADTWLGQTT